jgi:hypothetical protein
LEIASAFALKREQQPRGRIDGRRVKGVTKEGCFTVKRIVTSDGKSVLPTWPSLMAYDVSVDTLCNDRQDYIDLLVRIQ